MQAEYKTTDIVLAAYLRVNGAVLMRIDKQGQKGTFVFQNVSEELISVYDLGQALVEPVQFNYNIKSLTTSVRRIE
jgi:hypothetical protein